MSGAAPRIDLEAIRHRVSLVDLLPADAKPRRIGADRWKALCSFHGDKTPSMVVNYHRKAGWRFHCFACGEDGGVIDYVMRTQRLAFRDAALLLGGGRSEFLTVTTPARRRATTLLLVCDGKGCGVTREVETLLDAVVHEGAFGWRRREDDGRMFCPACCARVDLRRANQRRQGSEHAAP